MDITEYRRRIQEELDRAAADATALREMLDQRPPSEEEQRRVGASVAQRLENDVSRVVQIVQDRSADVTRRTLALDTISVDFARHQDLIDLVLAAAARYVGTGNAETRGPDRSCVPAVSASPVFAARRPDFLDTLRGLVDDPTPRFEPKRSKYWRRRKTITYSVV